MKKNVDFTKEVMLYPSLSMQFQQMNDIPCLRVSVGVERSEENEQKTDISSKMDFYFLSGISNNETSRGCYMHSIDGSQRKDSLEVGLRKMSRMMKEFSIPVQNDMFLNRIQYPFVTISDKNRQYFIGMHSETENFGLRVLSKHDSNTIDYSIQMDGSLKVISDFIPNYDVLCDRQSLYSKAQKNQLDELEMHRFDRLTLSQIRDAVNYSDRLTNKPSVICPKSLKSVNSNFVITQPIVLNENRKPKVKTMGLPKLEIK